MKSRKILSTILVLVFLLTACNVSIPTETTDPQEQIDELQTKLDDILAQAEAEQAELQAEIDKLIEKNESLENELFAVEENNANLSAVDEIAETTGSEAPTSSQSSTSQSAASSSASSAATTPTASSGTSNNANATKFFSTTKFEVYDWTTSAVNFGQSLKGTVFSSASGKIVAEITSGTVSYTGTGYEQSAQGLLNAVNDYRGAARATYNTNASASSATASGATSNNANAKKLFSTVTLEVYDWTTPTVDCGTPHEPKTGIYAFRDANGKELGKVITGTFNLAGTGYVETQGMLDAFNDYRGLERAEYMYGPNSIWRTSPNGSAASSSGDNQNSASSVDISGYASEVVRLVNKERANAGLDELTEDSDLNDFASVRAVEISTDFSHTRPDGTHVMDMGLGENCRYGSNTPQAAVKAWMDSSGHRDNILNDDYLSIGTGCYKDANGKMYWVIIFRKS